MNQERAEKHTVRALWLEEARDYANRYPEDAEPLYLTLSGAEGRDIGLFVEHGLIRLTETNSVAREDQGKVVAVESSAQAVLRLQRKYPGLKIVENNFQNLVRGTEQFRWPNAEEKRFCRARIINLDLNGELRANQQEEQIDFPIIAWIDKVARLHTHPSQRDWTLCLTLHGETNWSIEVSGFAQRFLRDNFVQEPHFAQSCRDLLGQALYEDIDSDSALDFSNLPLSAQQQILMVTVPKLIAQRVRNQGWKMTTRRNLRYGGREHAPMITWVVQFTWDAGALATPNAAHREALAAIFHFVGSIREDGQIEEDT